MRAIKSAKDEIARILTGHNVWSLQSVPVTPGGDKTVTITTGPHLVLTVRQFLPAGPVAGGRNRPVSLVDLSCDDGRRVIAVANIWSRNPEKASDPW